MKTVWVVQDILTGSYFLGGNPKPIFGTIEVFKPAIFDTALEARNRILEERELYPHLFTSRWLTLVEVMKAD